MHGWLRLAARWTVEALLEGDGSQPKLLNSRWNKRPISGLLPETMRGQAMRERVDRFRKNAEVCKRLSIHIKNPEHKALAAEFAAAWLELAKAVEKRLTALDKQPVTPAGDP